VDPQPTIDELVIADEPDTWRALGFTVDGDAAKAGSVRLRFEGRGERRGIVGWYVRGAGSLDLDGLETHASERPPVAGAEHPNELVQAPDGTSVAADPGGPARLWGISFLVRDMERTAALLGDLLGDPRNAVQPGRRIATVRREAGLGPAVAFMTAARR
jgi:hypothetical protein